jgi:hypothetical protein
LIASAEVFGPVDFIFALNIGVEGEGKLEVFRKIATDDNERVMIIIITKNIKVKFVSRNIPFSPN